MTWLALLLALAQQGGPTPNDRPGVSQPSTQETRPEMSTSSNTSDKAEPLSPEHHTDLQGGKPAKKAKSKKAQARAAKPMPEPSTPPSVELKEPEHIERKAGKGKAPKQPKPLGEKSDQ